MPIPIVPVGTQPPPSGGGGQQPGGGGGQQPGGTPATKVYRLRPSYTGFGVEFQRDGFSPLRFATKTVTGNGWRMSTGMQGTDAPPVELYDEAIPDGAGSIYLGARYGKREMFFQLSVNDVSYEATRDRMRALWSMVGDLQPFQVVIRQPEGDAWSATCRYVSGLEGSYGPDDWWVSRRRIGLTVVALDPLFYGSLFTRSWAVNAAKARPLLSASSPFFPVVLGDSLVAGEQVLIVSGDEPTWPTITVSGPGNGLVVSHLDTGRQVSVTGTLLAGQSVTIQGDPMDVFDETGGDAWDRIPIGEYPWQLLPGRNRVKVDLAAATSASVVTMSWRPARRTGH